MCVFACVRAASNKIYPIVCTLRTLGDKIIHAHHTGHQKNRFAVVLSSVADGRMLKGLIIWKGLKKLPKMLDLPDNMGHCVAPGIKSFDCALLQLL